MTIQDWGVTYDELEPHYDRFEYLCGTSGKAGNLERPDPGRRQSVRRAALAPLSDTRRMKQPFSHTLFAKAARELGYKPFPQPSGNLSQAYTNPLGVRLGPCTYCGFCEWFGCGNYSKASPQTTHPAGAGAQVEFQARDRMRSDARSISTAPASAPPASPSSTPAARNGSSRPSSSSSPPSRSSTCSCCCCRASAQPYDPADRTRA